MKIEKCDNCLEMFCDGYERDYEINAREYCGEDLTAIKKEFGYGGDPESKVCDYCAEELEKFVDKRRER